MIAKKALITAGPTHEPIDPVRFIGNRSSGKQGVALAKAFANGGYEVILVVGPVADEILQSLPSGVEVERVQTADEMLSVSLKYITMVDIAIHNAAVCDYKIKNIQNTKIKKSGKVKFSDLEFVENVDLLATFGLHAQRPKILIGFAAETDNFIENAQEKLKKKNCDYIVVNDVSNGKVFGKDTNKASIISNDRIIELNEMSKDDLARQIFEMVK